MKRLLVLLMIACAWQLHAQNVTYLVDVAKTSENRKVKVHTSKGTRH